MPGGRPPKPAAARKVAGTHRKDRPTLADTTPPPKAKRAGPPEEVSPALREKWQLIVSDLEAVGAVSNTDLIRLSRAFRQLGNAMLFQAELLAAINDPEASPSDKTKYQTAITSATTSFNTIVESLQRSVAMRPKIETSDEWES